MCCSTFFSKIFHSHGDVTIAYEQGGWFIWLFTVSRLAQKFLTYMETSLLPVKGYKSEACTRQAGPLTREGSLSCNTCCDTGPRLSHPKDRPIKSPGNPVYLISIKAHGWYVWPVSRGCLFLLGTWSYRCICRGSMLPYSRFCICFRIHYIHC
jgi:hypothetical protein